MKYFLLVTLFTGLYAFAELPQTVSDKKVSDNLEYLDQKVSDSSFPSRTKAELNRIKPSREGMSFYCSDCTPKKIVISTGSSTASWASCDGGAFQ